MYTTCREYSGKSQGHSQRMTDIYELITLIQRSRRIDRVLLHGSFARGDIREGSDIDLILVGEFPERFHKRTVSILELTDLPVEPLCYTQEEFDQMVKNKNSFIMAALEEGIQVYPEPKDLWVQNNQ